MEIIMVLPCHPKTFTRKFSQEPRLDAGGAGCHVRSEWFGEDVHRRRPRDRGGASCLVFFVGGVPELSW